MTLEHGALARLARNRIGLKACMLAIALGVAGPAGAYVVVTSDNQVYEVPTRPEIRGDMVYFTLDGIPVSMRVYDLNVAKTNEFNYALDSGGNPMAVAREARRLPPAMPDDRRMRPSQAKTMSARFTRGEERLNSTRHRLGRHSLAGV